MMRSAKHDLIASGALRLRVKEIGCPPGTDLSHKEQGVADPKPHEQPMRVRFSKVQEAEHQADGKRNALDKRHNQEALRCVLAADRGDIVEAVERNPIVKPEKKHLEHQQCEQSDLDTVGCWEEMFRHFRYLGKAAQNSYVRDSGQLKAALIKRKSQLDRFRKREPFGRLTLATTTACVYYAADTVRSDSL